MFDLEKQISEWRKQILAAGIKTPVPLEELENHLREEIERQMKSGQNSQNAFEHAAQMVGDARQLENEFAKIEMQTWNYRLAWTAWALLFISFLLPAFVYSGGPFGGGEVHLWGWECAKDALQHAFALLSGKTDALADGGFYLALQTLPNLLMIVWPLLVWKFFHGSQGRQFLRRLGVAAMILVWSYVTDLLSAGNWQNLEIGCYVWVASFALLAASTIKIGARKTICEKYV